MLRWIGRLLSLVVFLALLAVGFVALMPAERVAQLAADQLRAATGRDVTVSGDVSVSFWPVLGARVGALEIGNADWSRQGPMLTANDAAIGIEAAALLRGEIRITHIEAASPTIRLESRRDGRASWQFTDATGAARIETETAPGRRPQAVSIQRLQITDATLIHDAEGQALVDFRGVDLTLDWPERNGAAQIDAVARPAGAPVSLSARVEQFAEFVAGEMRPVDVTLETPQGAARLEGRAAISGAAAGVLALTTSDTDGFLRALGLDGVNLPHGMGRSLEVTADLDLTPDRQMALRGLDAALGAGNRLRGTADFALSGTTPRIDADLTAGALDLSGLTREDGSEGSGAGDPGAAQGWSTAPIDASGLAAFDGDIALVADSVDLGAVTLGPSRVALTNNRSRMVATLREVTAYGGTVKGEFVMNNRDGLSVGGRMTGESLALGGGLLADLAGITRLDGTATADLEFLGVGQSVDAIMRSLRGKGALTVGRGSIRGVDLDRLMRSGDAGPGTTVFDSLDASFTIENGDLRNDDLLMLLPRFEARGAGRVGLGARDLDYRITPKALRVNEARGLAIPVRIRGPWSAPRVEPDLAAAVELNLGEERARAEQELRRRVEDRIADELGVSPEAGQSVEDAIEKKLESEIGKGLKRLFD